MEQLIRLVFLMLGYVLGVGTVGYMARHAFKIFTNEVYANYKAKLIELQNIIDEGCLNEQRTDERH